LNKALQVDPGNVVAARLLADSYLALGDKLEAIKKYKLVRALLPADEELDAVIERLENDLNPVTLFQAPGEDTLSGGAARDAGALMQESPFASEDTHPLPEPEPEPVTPAESPYQEPLPDYTAAAVAVEQPPGVHIETAPPAAQVPAPWPEEEPASEVFAPAEAPPLPAAPPSSAIDEVVNTVTMAELYVQQGFIDKARDIYQNILQREPGNREVRGRLEALGGSQERNPKVDKLERWLAKVTKREEGSVI
jgi:tetratricopeptide (TPR) repeat protein